jgi:hypothetical protein
MPRRGDIWGLSRVTMHFVTIWSATTRARAVDFCVMVVALVRKLIPGSLSEQEFRELRSVQMSCLGS